MRRSPRDEHSKRGDEHSPKQQGTMASNKAAKTGLSAVTFDRKRYVELLTKIVGKAETLQNSPPQGLYPREDNCSDYVLAALKPYTVEEGGPLIVERVAFTEGRGNVIIKYPGATAESVGFVGSHMDVVPANPENWKRDPFKLTVEGDELHGRGTTDCLGHVAMVTELMLELAIKKPALRRTVTAVFIANEENGMVQDIGVDALMKTGKMDCLKSGPVIWVDCADMHPCMGTASSIVWHLKATGKLFHSGLPHKGINALELANVAVSQLQDAFYSKFPATPQEAQYKFMTCSTMKPTQVKCATGSLNQLPAWVQISGDIRATPFYDVAEIKAGLDGVVKEMNENITGLRTFGPHSKYEIADARGSLELTWADEYLEGVACSLESEGHKALLKSTEATLGEVKPYSIGGSLPLVRDLQRGGFDIQMTGFGNMSTYHADNEYCKLSDQEKGFAILKGVIANLE